MERIPAFKPKIPENETSSAQEKREKTEGPLRVMERDKAQITGFNFALEGILKGKITTKAQLEVLANPTFKPSGLGNIAVYRDGSYVQLTGGEYLPESDFGKRLLLEEYVPVLVGIIKERNTASQEKSSAEAQITGFNFALEGILKGKITTKAQLEVLANPTFKPSGLGNIAVYRDGSYVQLTGGEYLPESDFGKRQISKEDFGLLNRLFKVINDPNFPDEVRINFKQYVQTGDIKSLERLNTVMAAADNDAMSSEVEGIVGDLIDSRRIIGLKKDVYGGIVDNKPVAEISKRITGFEGKEAADLQLVAELQTAVAAKRKIETLASAAQRLQAANRNIDQVIAEVTPLLRSNRSDEREAGAELLKATCTVEIANFKNEVQKMITANVDPEMVRIFISGFKPRPTVGDIDYIATIVDVREKAFQSIGEILKMRSLEAATKIRESFATLSVDLVLANIDKFPGETERDGAIRAQLLELYKSYVAANKPEIFDSTFAEAIQKREKEQLEAKFVSPEKGRNQDAFDFMRNRFVETIYPLVESLRADITTAPVMKKLLDSNPKDVQTPNPRLQFEQRMSSFEKQRQLTDVERNYLQSVELLSLFNPYLVASAYADRGVTSEFLKHHFETLSKETTSDLKDGDYFPLIHIGLGPNGLAAIGEVVRNNADLASGMLVVDAGKQPGGPFAIPEGAAWRLNSANKRGAKGRTLPNKPGSKELETIRAYGSPVRLTPGERVAGKDTRGGSINSTVDYLLSPDDLPTSRYPTNEELQLVLALQAAVLTKNVALETRVVGVEKNPNPDTQGDKLVTLEITDATGVRRVKVTTDAIFGATGLGESGYGFKLEGSRAEKVIEETKDSAGFPRISKTLDAFNAFASRSREQVSPGETLVIYGGGNSADTIIEYVGNLFQGDNPLVNNITKLYIISETDLSGRPRYKLIEDLRGRNGKGNLIEQVRAKVGDVGFEGDKGATPDRKLVFYDRNNQLIKNEKGVVITGDSAVAATGFRSTLDKLLENYAKGVSSGSDQTLRKPVTLPTNERVSVAETLKSDPSVLILGVASDADYENTDKLAQLQSTESAQALLRNGPENAVAIGFRAPDTQAAVNIWLNSQDIQVEKRPRGKERKKLIVSGVDNMLFEETSWLPRSITVEEARIPNNIQDEMRLLSPLFTYNVGNSIELTTPEGGRFTGELNFTLTYSPEDKMLGLTLNKDNSLPVSKEVVEAVQQACTDETFQRYALVALKKKRRDPKLDLVLSFKNGFVDPKTTFVQD